jgi:hypothetical protein
MELTVGWKRFAGRAALVLKAAGQKVRGAARPRQPAGSGAGPWPEGASHEQRGTATRGRRGYRRQGARKGASRPTRSPREADRDRLSQGPDFVTRRLTDFRRAKQAVQEYGDSRSIRRQLDPFSIPQPTLTHPLHIPKRTTGSIRGAWLASGPTVSERVQPAPDAFPVVHTAETHIPDRSPDSVIRRLEHALPYAAVNT